jgi:endonuclease-3
MNDKERTYEVIKRLEGTYSEEKGTILNHKNPLELLIATILSAQSTDKQINKITRKLFKKYRTAADYANASKNELKNDIRSSGFFNRKTDAIQKATRKIIEIYDGKVPDTMEDLVNLNGVGRKTANIVLSGAFGKIEGIAVDTHVYRISRLLRLTVQKNRNKVEQDLMKLIPREKWFAANYLFITHGRRICKAKKPDCEHCILSDLCPSAFTFPKRKGSATKKGSK